MGRYKQSWLVDYFVLDGDTAKPEVWQRLADVLNKDYPHESGITMPIRVMCVDSGYATQDVYGFVKNFNQTVWGGNGARANSPRTVVAIKAEIQVISDEAKGFRDKTETFKNLSQTTFNNIATARMIDIGNKSFPAESYTVKKYPGLTR